MFFFLLFFFVDYSVWLGHRNAIESFNFMFTCSFRLVLLFFFFFLLLKRQFLPIHFSPCVSLKSRFDFFCFKKNCIVHWTVDDKNNSKNGRQRAHCTKHWFQMNWRMPASHILFNREFTNERKTHTRAQLQVNIKQCDKMTNGLGVRVFLSSFHLQFHSMVWQAELILIDFQWCQWRNKNHIKPLFTS